MCKKLPRFFNLINKKTTSVSDEKKKSVDSETHEHDYTYTHSCVVIYLKYSRVRLGDANFVRGEDEGEIRAYSA